MDWLARDLRIGARMLARDKGFSATAALTLAICIGANTALFTVVHHVLLRPLPVPEPDRILLMANQYPGAGASDSSNSGAPDYFDRRRDTTVFRELALFNYSSVSVGEEGLPVRLRVANVTPSYFRLMGVAPALGRAFTEEEGEVGRDKEVVLSAGLWHRHFASDTGVLGKELRLDGRPYTVVGVMPASFQPVDPRAVLWRPLSFSAEDKSDGKRHSNNWWNIGRLRPGATRRQAQSEIDALNQANLERFPQYKELLMNAGFHTTVEVYPEHLVKDVRATLYLLWGGAIFVLIIGGVNVTNLVLVRARSRLKELATRVALGAEARHLARALVVEGVILTTAAAAAGLALGALTLRSLGAFDLQDLPYGADIHLDLAAVLYSLGLSAVIGVAIGLVPLAALVPANLTAVLREEGRSTSAGRGARALRRALVVGQVAFTFVLLVGAGLLLASFRKVLAVDPGFDADRVLTASVVLPRSRNADDNARRVFTEEAVRRVRALPGVTAAGATDTIPFGGNNSDSVILAEGYEMKPGESVISPSAVDVTPGYFEAMGARLRRGRFFQDSDGAGALPVIMVDETLARRFWPGLDPIGRRLYRPTDINNLVAVNDKTVFLTVVGVIADIKLHDLTEGKRSVGAYYFPMAQDTSTSLTFAVKTAGRPETVAGGVRTAIASLDRELPVFDVQSMEQRTEKSLLNRRSPAMLALGFAMVALLLSAVGIYGVLAYLVTQRKKEIGIRIALGSTTRGIFDLILREGVGLLAAGFLLGAAGALMLRRTLEGQLFGITATDPLVVGAVAALLAAVALAACALPARRATRINPVLALME
jgi:putative ABC transport system permease protein